MRTSTSLIGLPALIILSASLITTHAAGDMVYIENPSFEADVVGDGSAVGAISGWSRNDTSSGTYNPTTTQYPGDVPDGQNVAFSNGGGTSGGLISQELTETLQANKQYVLQVWVGNRTDVTFPGYEIQFRAGGRLLAADNNLLTPSNGAFLESVIQYRSTDLDPALGDPLRISLRARGVQVNFDNVRLSATAVPEPACGFLLTTLVVGTVTRRRRR